MYPLALEGALKLKEISYIHAEGYASGELKHGPIALVDKSVPVIVMAPRDALFDKTVSNMQEVMARGGQVLLVTDARGARAPAEGVWETLVLPDAAPLGADPLRRAGAAPRLPHGHRQGDRRRPAAQPRQVRHGGMRWPSSFPPSNPPHVALIEESPIFFVATAAEDGHVNLSPKGRDSVRVARSEPGDLAEPDRRATRRRRTCAGRTA